MDDPLEALRQTASRQIHASRKSEYGQYFTPSAVARIMASLIECEREEVSILDAGAGVGSLFAAAVMSLCSRHPRPRTIRVSAYEIDPDLGEFLEKAKAACSAHCGQAGVGFSAEILHEDFLEAAAGIIDGSLFAEEPVERFDLAILNPPYFKINTGSRPRRTIERFSVGTTNIYTGFLAAAARLLKPNGEMIAITPRSFCNGTYFRPFRKWFLDAMRLRRLHSFASREEAFRHDDVLQETLIFRAVKGANRGRVVVSSSYGPEDAASSRSVEYDRIVRPDDAQHYIRIPSDDLAEEIGRRMAACRASLADLKLDISTGRVVDFRARKYLRFQPAEGTAPLIWPGHFNRGTIVWPREGVRKPQFLQDDPAIADQLVPSEPYVVVRRFSAKEEARRIVAALYDPRSIASKRVGFENHVNYFHHRGRGLEFQLARGLTAFLNSSFVDQFFRQFSGHTQVNATDLRNMLYPSREQLERIGAAMASEFPDQAGADALVARELFDGDRVAQTFHERTRRSR